MSGPSVPRRAELLLEALGADTDFRDNVMGDLAEEFASRVQRDGPGAARRWYYRESLRVAPYLLRDWWRNLGWKHLGYFTAVVLLASISLMVLEWLLQRGVRGLSLITPGRSVEAYTASAFFPFLMLAWTLIDGAFAGYVAARIGRRAPLPSALLVGITWIAVMIWSSWHAVPSWFLAANVTTMIAGTVAGGMVCAMRRVRAR